MTRMVHCAKLDQELPALEVQPYPGELGEKVYETISAQAWKMWLEHQTMLINEYRLSMLDPKAREFLALQMKKFLFEGGADKPEGYVEPED